ncbi:MAG: aspartate kinase [Parachlamydiaceae bacterium]
MDTLVMKFGGASVATPQHFERIASIVIEKQKRHKRTIVVVSAMGKTTDELISLAKQVHPNPPRREYDMLVSVGERISISLLAMALHLRGCEAISFTGSQTGIITSEQHSEARIVDLRPDRLKPHLDSGQVVIVAGFQGVSRSKQITTLGRGGSDTSAVALGVSFQAQVEFYKDVPGVFSHDPKCYPDAKHFASLTYDEALDIANGGAKVLHPRAVELAKRNAVPLRVLSFLEEGGAKQTIIGSENASRPPAPLFEVSDG